MKTKFPPVIQSLYRMIFYMLAAGMMGCSHEQGNLTDQAALVGGKQESHELLQTWCADCHAPPQLNSHPLSEWPSIVMRMQNHRIVKGMTAIPEPEIDNIISYLQTHAQMDQF